MCVCLWVTACVWCVHISMTVSDKERKTIRFCVCVRQTESCHDLECVCVGPHLDLHGGGGQGCDLLLHAITDTRVHGGTTRQDVVGVQVLTDVNVTFHDAVVGGFMDASRLHS